VMLRGSGIKWDLRKVAPYDKYDEVGALAPQFSLFSNDLPGRIRCPRRHQWRLLRPISVPRARIPRVIEDHWAGKFVRFA
jgi:hypothetical protein